MPHDVQPFINGLVEKVAIHGMSGEDPLWQAVCDAVISYPTVVATNTVIALYTAGNGSFVSRAIGMHRAERPLGHHFIACGKPGCPSRGNPGHMMGEIKDYSAKIRCRACGWRSKWVRIDEQDVFTPVHKTRAPFLFYHTYPPTALESAFLG
jgi:hypothetical protein